MATDEMVAIARAAQAWREADYAPRARAVAAALEADPPFTEEALSFVLNHRMHTLDEATLRSWCGERRSRNAGVVGVISEEAVPLGAFRDTLAGVVAGQRVLLPASSSAHVVAAFFADAVAGRVHAVPEDEVAAQAEAVVGWAEDARAQEVRARLAERGVGGERVMLCTRSTTVAVLDGRENDDAREDLATDVLLLDGHGPWSPRILWAPGGTSPDPYLEAFAHFRAVCPAHASTPGRLKMQQAFLQATDQPHAYGDDLSFLVSKGAPEVQPPGHVRWCTYDDLSTVRAWVEAAENGVHLVLAATRVAERLGAAVPVDALGNAHRPPLERAPCGMDVLYGVLR